MPLLFGAVGATSLYGSGRLVGATTNLATIGSGAPHRELLARTRFDLLRNLPTGLHD
jgi:hypothetical protein